MNTGSNREKVVEVTLADGTIMDMEVSVAEDDFLEGGEEYVSATTLSFDNVTQQIKSIAKQLNDVLAEAQPERASVEFSVELAVEAGRLTGVLVKGGGKTTLKIKLEWGSC